MKTLKNMAMVVAGILLAGSPGATAALTDFTLQSGSGTTADPGVYQASGTGLNQVIPDNTPTGVAYSLNFAAGGPITDVSVTLNISGGYNGDLTAYLAHGSQISYLLLANPAISSSGITATFIEGTGNAIPTGGSGNVSGTTFTAASGDLAGFNTTTASGDWTLFFADMSPGDTSTLGSFYINITAVPEPVNVALGIFGLTVVGLGVGRRCFRRHHPANF